MDAGIIRLEDLPEREHVAPVHDAVLRRQQVFGYTEEELRILITPMAATAAEAIGSMGTDTPEAVLSRRPRMLFDYFSQLFAQVTNPPLDAIREQVVTSLAGVIGPEQNLLEPSPPSCRHVVLPYPAIDNDDLAKLVGINADGNLPGFASAVITGLFEVDRGGDGLAEALERCRREADQAIAAGARILILSDRDSDATRAPIPSLLLTSAVHHHLVRGKKRTQVGLVVESGDAREVHHVALLLGYGAAVVNPYLLLETVEDLAAQGLLGDVAPAKALRNTVYALSKGVLKVMSKMGISTVASYTGAQVFASFGLDQHVIDEYFEGTSSPAGGSNLGGDRRRRRDPACAGLQRQRRHPRTPGSGGRRRLPVASRGRAAPVQPGDGLPPAALHQVQAGVGLPAVHRHRGRAVQAGWHPAWALRAARRRHPIGAAGGGRAGRRYRPALRHRRDELRLHLRRGAHHLAIAMNRLGGRSNTGEGGEDVDRLLDPERRSAIKQVASGRFGVTSAFLVNAAEIQIKMAQGAKPGEGGQLPGHKVYPWIAATRNATTGVGLISPPPHHDIYSIEDLKQLIHDLRNANPVARVSVKLVSEPGVGTVAAGVAKAHADTVIVAGYDGGTGAAPLTSLKHAGQPWELGLAEAQQTLRLNKFREQIRLQVDGGLKTGRDVIVAALLGAEEFGFSTAPLVVSGCVMMRVCHLDTCPVGIATQNPVLRERYTGTPEFVETFFLFLAEQVREYLAALGFRSIDEAVGHAELLDIEPAVAHHRAHGLDLSPLLHVADVDSNHWCVRPATHDLSRTLDAWLIAGRPRPRGRAAGADRGHDPECGPHRGNHARLRGDPAVRSGRPAARHHPGRPGRHSRPVVRGVPAAGDDADCSGDANDYVAKGLSGGPWWSGRRPNSRPQVASRDRRQHHRLRRHLRRALPARHRRRAVRGAQLRRAHGRRGHRGPCLRVHDRRPGRHPRSDRAQRRRRDERRHRLPARRRTTKVNPELVDVEPLADDEVVWLGETIRTHADLTGSVIATALLDDWTTSAARFVRIMPRDYRRVLEMRAEAATRGVDADDLIMEASHG